MKRILTIVGARPQFIKAAAISHAISELYADKLQEDILHTGQHYDTNMSGTFFDELSIPQPKYNLSVGSATHGAQTAAMLEGIEKVLLSKHYDGVLVYGDTNSTLAGALAAAKLGVPVYHVEAGLRSFNKTMPEELNRVLTDHASTLLFAPTQTAVDNLRNEGFIDAAVALSGDVMLDNVRHYAAVAEQKATLPYCAERLILATVHRNFNTDSPQRLESILAALCTVAERLDAQVLLPLHPRTRQRLGSMMNSPHSSLLHIVEPLGYLQTLLALRQSKLVLTDSGGLQKEAFFSGRGCVVLRHETEWTEIVDCGAALLADADVNAIVSAAERMWDAKVAEPTQFGDGHAAEYILEAIVNDMDRPTAC